MREYDFPLANWIAACQHRGAIDEIVRRIANGETIDELLVPRNVAFIDRLVYEEVTKQFAQADKPVVEVAMNAADAGQKKGMTCDVHIRADAKHVEINDNGDSMDLEEILKYLILPFCTIKDETPTGTYIGEFGVGFFSTFRYCIEDPMKGSVLVETHKEGASYRTRFYSAGTETSTLRMRMAGLGSVNDTGTRVTITKAFNLYALENFITAQVRNIPEFVARIHYNNRRLNPSECRWYTSPAALTSDKGETCQQAVALQETVPRKPAPPKIVLTSRGVAVTSFDSPAQRGITVLFPSLVRLVHGRDAFKHDDNYYRAIDSAFIALADMMSTTLQASQDKATVRAEYIELIPSLTAAFGLEDLTKVHHIDGLEAILLPGKRYVFLQKEFDRLKEFADLSAVFTASPQSCAAWGKRHTQYQRFLDDLCTVHEILTRDRFMQRLTQDESYYPNLGLLASQDMKEYRIDEIALISAPPQAPYMIDEDTRRLYINTKHRYIAGKTEGLKRSMSYAAFLRLPVVEENHKDHPEYIEREMLRRSGRMIA